MHRTPPTKENIAAIAVAFHPDTGFFDRMRALAPQVHNIIIVDNHSNPESLQTIERVRHELANVYLIQNDTNVGIATALNIGIARAREEGSAWALTMDHDSLADPMMVQELTNAYRAAEKKGITLDLIGANFIYETTGKRAFAKECEGKAFIRKVGIQTSGALLSLYAYEAIGPFREDFFIDYVDTEYCLRLKHRGFVSAIACKAHMLHCIGNIEKHPLLGTVFTSANYSALRRYYRTRNGLQVVREYLFKEPMWVLRKLCYILYELAIVFGREKDKRRKLVGFFKGIRDNLLDKSGKALV